MFVFGVLSRESMDNESGGLSHQTGEDAQAA